MPAPKSSLGPDQPEKEANLPKTRIGSRKITKYDEGLAFRVCEEIASGRTLTAACKEEWAPTAATFIRWTLTVPELAEVYDQARVISAYILEDETLETARNLENRHKSGTEVRAKEISIKQKNWLAGKRNKTVFGEQSNQVIVPVQINTSLDLEHDTMPEVEASGNEIFTIEMEPEAPKELRKKNDGKQLQLAKPGKKPGPKGPRKRQLNPKEPYKPLPPVPC